jgi:hypothetical protein
MYGNIQLCEIQKHVKFFQSLIKTMNILIQGKMVGHILSKEGIFSFYKFDKVKIWLQPLHFQHQ